MGLDRVDEGSRAQAAGGSRHLPRGAVVAGTLAAIAAVVVAVMVLANGGDDDEAEAGAPREVSAEELRGFAEGEERPVYWAGEIEGTKLELTETSRSYVYVRYLDELAPVDDEKPLYTTIGTYPQADALEAVRKAGGAKGMVRREAPGGGLAVWSRLRPTSVYLAFPGSDYLVEVFHPKARSAQHLALSGRVEPAF